MENFNVIRQAVLDSMRNEVEAQISNSNLAALLELNIEAEADARKGYYQLIEALRENGGEANVPIIEEIISDELNHAEKLKELLAQYSDIQPSKS